MGDDEGLGPDVPLHFTAFHPDYKMLDLPGTPAARLARRPGTLLSEDDAGVDALRGLRVGAGT